MEIVALGATSKGLEGKMEREQNEYGWWIMREAVNFGVPAFVSEAKAELARLIDDVQKNRNRPEELP